MAAAAVMVGQDRTVVAVFEHGQLHGLVTRRDLLRHFAGKDGSNTAPQQISVIMTKNPIVADLHVSLVEALELMTRHNIGHLPVCDQGRLVGIVQERDVLCGLLNAMKSDYSQMREYIEHLHLAGQD